MQRIMMIAIFLGITGCEYINGSNVDSPRPNRIEQVLRCNKYKTCVVVFADGHQGLMTSPKEGEYGCKSMSAVSYNKCDAP